MKIGITGSTGFIGSHLTSQLAKEGHEVNILVHNPAFLSSTRSVPDEVKVIYGDLFDVETLRKFARDTEIIVHLAAITQGEPVEILKTNVLGTLNLLETAKSLGINKIIFTSSFCVYGEAQFVPITEDHPTIPKSLFSLSKLYAEQLCNFYSESCGMKTIILRLSNVYGPHGHQGVVPTFIRKILRNEPLMIQGNGKQLRDFIYVTDTVKGLVQALNYNPRDSNGTDIFNICTSVGTTIMDLASNLMELLGREVPLQFIEQTQDIQRSVGSYVKAAEKFSFKPTVPLDLGLKQTLAHFENSSGGKIE